MADFGAALERERTLVDLGNKDKQTLEPLDAFIAPFMVHGQTIKVGATVGASLYPHHADDLDMLLHAADQALYRMKRNDKDSWAWFDHTLEVANDPQRLASVM